jgi:hypothetical protein
LSAKLLKAASNNIGYVLHSDEKSLKIPKGNQNPYIEEEQTTQWPKDKGPYKRSTTVSISGFYIYRKT